MRCAGHDLEWGVAVADRHASIKEQPFCSSLCRNARQKQ
jgi:hypothetical protein